MRFGVAWNSIFNIFNLGARGDIVSWEPEANGTGITHIIHLNNIISNYFLLLFV